MTGQPIHIDQARFERAVRSYRSALRSANDIARRGLSHQGESRETALMNIDRITAKALNEN